MSRIHIWGRFGSFILLACCSTLLQSQIEEPPTVFITEENADPEVVWFGLAGSYYAIEYSTDLSIWIQSDVTRIGNNEPFKVKISEIFANSSAPPRAFVRVMMHEEGSSLDSDGDGIPNWWEIRFGTGYNIANADANSDGDFFTNIDEFNNGTNPLAPDSDGDGTPDHLDTAPLDSFMGGDPDADVIDLRLFTTTFLGPTYPPNLEPFYDVKFFRFDPNTSNETLVRNISYSGNFLNETFSLPRDGSIYSMQMDLPFLTDTPNGQDFRDFEFFTAIRPPVGQTRFTGWHVADGFNPTTGDFTPGRILLEGRNQYSINFTQPRALVIPITISGVNSESGVDNNILRFDPADDLEAPWVMVPAGGENNSFTLEGFQQFVQPLTISSNTLTISPTMTGASNAVEVTISGTGVQGDTETIEVGNSGRNTTVAKLAVYPRKDFTVAMHTVNLPNDDELVMQNGNVLIKEGCGLPFQTCITTGDNSNLLFSIPQVDDLRVGNIINTGPNGICDTPVSGSDNQVIPVGQGQSDALFLAPGPNGVVNTSRSGFDELTAQGLTTGDDGIRDTEDPVPLLTPIDVLTPAELEEYLNIVYGKQANVFFTVTATPSLTVDFDSGGEVPTNPRLSSRIMRNNAFDAVTSTNGRSVEESLVLDPRFDANSDFNLFFLPVNLRLHFDGGNNSATGNPLLGTRRALGIGRNDVTLGERIAYISALGLTSTDLLSMICGHEIGHLRFPESFQNLGHPRESNNGEPLGRPNSSSNSFPLKTANEDRKRLMRPQLDLINSDNEINPETNRPFSKLIKEEWDVLQGIMIVP